MARHHHVYTQENTLVYIYICVVKKECAPFRIWMVTFIRIPFQIHLHRNLDALPRFPLKMVKQNTKWSH